jgi:ubiquitin-conjugating enzyme E2 variant
MLEAMDILLKIIACVLIADFLSGLFHWIEDTFFDLDTPMLGKWVVRHNIVHHHEPRAFVRKSWYRSARSTLFLSAVGLALAAAAGAFNWMTVLVALLCANANEIHKWSHRTRSENGRFIVLLQRARILQTPGHHAAHHRDGKDTHYCVLTNFVNPLLDAIDFWRGLEWLLCDVVGLRKRPDRSLEHARPAAA